MLVVALWLSVVSPGEPADANAADHADAARAGGARPDAPRPKPAPRRPAPRAPAKVQHGPITVPIDVGVGPVFMFPNPPALADQIGFTGLELSLAAVISKELIRANEGRIPASMRGAARGLSEVKYRPWFVALIPERLVISPQIAGVANTGMYGAVWRPVGAGINLLNGPVDVSLDGAVDVAYIFIHSATLGGGSVAHNSITHFLRPGVNIALTAEIPLGESVAITGGWSSDLFIPQPFGGSPLEIAPLDNALWHLGGPFIQLHVHIPYEVNL